MYWKKKPSKCSMWWVGQNQTDGRANVHHLLTYDHHKETIWHRHENLYLFCLKNSSIFTGFEDSFPWRCNGFKVVLLIKSTCPPLLPECMIASPWRQKTQVFPNIFTVHFFPLSQDFLTWSIAWLRNLWISAFFNCVNLSHSNWSQYHFKQVWMRLVWRF